MRGQEHHIVLVGTHPDILCGMLGMFPSMRPAPGLAGRGRGCRMLIHGDFPSEFPGHFMLELHCSVVNEECMLYLSLREIILIRRG
jgi:hypothetical protein